jgi:hypothetical protein
MPRGTNHSTKEVPTDTEREQKAQVERQRAPAITTSTGLRRRERRFESCRGHHVLPACIAQSHRSEQALARSRGMVHGTNSVHEPLHTPGPTRVPRADRRAQSPGSAGQRAALRRQQALSRDYSRPGCALLRGGAPQALLCTSDRRAPTTMTESVLSVGPGGRCGRAGTTRGPCCDRRRRFIELVLRGGRPPAGSLSSCSPARGSPSGSDLGSRVGGWPGRSLGACLTRLSAHTTRAIRPVARPDSK